MGVRACKIRRRPLRTTPTNLVPCVYVKKRMYTIHMCTNTCIPARRCGDNGEPGKLWAPETFACREFGILMSERATTSSWKGREQWPPPSAGLLCLLSSRPDHGPSAVVHARIRVTSSGMSLLDTQDRLKPEGVNRHRRKVRAPYRHAPLSLSPSLHGHKHPTGLVCPRVLEMTQSLYKTLPSYKSSPPRISHLSGCILPSLAVLSDCLATRASAVLVIATHSDVFLYVHERKGAFTLEDGEVLLANIRDNPCLLQVLELWRHDDLPNQLSPRRHTGTRAYPHTPFADACMVSSTSGAPDHVAQDRFPRSLDHSSLRPSSLGQGLTSFASSTEEARAGSWAVSLGIENWSTRLSGSAGGLCLQAGVLLKSGACPETDGEREQTFAHPSGEADPPRITSRHAALSISFAGP